MLSIGNLTIEKFNFITKLLKLIIILSPIIALVSRTSFDIPARVVDFLFLNKCLFSSILRIFNLVILVNLSDFLIKNQ